MLTEMASADTLPKLLKQTYEKYGDEKVAMRKKAFGVWEKYTWKDCYENTKYLSLGLLNLGLEPGNKVAIIGDNAPQWYWAEWAVQAVGGVALGVFTDCVVSEVKYILKHSGSTFVVAKDQEQVDKLLALKDELPEIKRVIYWDYKGLWSYEDPLLISFEQVLEMGANDEKAHPGVFEEMVRRGNGGGIATLCYTSGTTDLPKGVILTHNNLINTYKSTYAPDPMYETDQYVSVISPAWVMEQWVSLTGALITGITVNFPEAPETAKEDFREVAPHSVGNPTRLWEGIASAVQATMNDAGLISKLVYNLFLPVGYRVADFQYAREKPSPFWRFLYWIGYLAIFRPVKDTFGFSKARISFTTGAILSPDAFRFFRAFGMNLKQMYGLTEAGTAFSHRSDDVRFETIGPVLPEVEVRISDDGEILIASGAVFKGYHNNPDATREKLVGKWFHTGDAGHFTDEGHVVFLDRVSDLRQLAGGDKYAPSFIEGRLRFSPYIKDAMCVGDQEHDYVTAVLIIDFDIIGRWAEDHHIPYTTFADLSQKPEIYKLTMKEVERVNKAIPPFAHVRRYSHLQKEFDPDEAELTRTGKIRRTFMEERYRVLIEALYGDSNEILIEAEVKYRDGRTSVMTTPVKIMSLEEEMTE